MTSRLLALVVTFALASPAFAQLPVGPVIALGPPGLNRANLISCLPSDFATADPNSAPCTITVIAPQLNDLMCVQLVNVSLGLVLEQVQPLPPELPRPRCVPASQNSAVEFLIPRPAIGSGSIIFVAVAVRTNFQVTQASANTGIIPDISFRRLGNVVFCPLAKLGTPAGQKVVGCPVPGNDVNPFDFSF